MYSKGGNVHLVLEFCHTDLEVRQSTVMNTSIFHLIVIIQRESVEMRITHGLGCDTQQRAGDIARERQELPPHDAQGAVVPSRQLDSAQST